MIRRGPWASARGMTGAIILSMVTGMDTGYRGGMVLGITLRLGMV